MTEPGTHLLENPFFVLGLPPTAGWVEAERQAQKLLGMLELGLAQAATYATPLGTRARTPELVRWAVAELREPARRLRSSPWALLPSGDSPARRELDGEAFRALGF